MQHIEIRGPGTQRTEVAHLELTFPPTMIELVRCDGASTDQQVISTPYLPSFGSDRIEVLFDAHGKKGVRFVAWDLAYQRAMLQPQVLQIEER